LDRIWDSFPRSFKRGPPSSFSNPPLGVQIDGRPFAGIRSILARDRGRFLKRLHRPHRFRVWLHPFEGEIGSECYYGLGPAYLNAGLMKPRRGFPPAAGEEKLGVGKVNDPLDKSFQPA
jgi:hypothetical protein